MKWQWYTNQSIFDNLDEYTGIYNPLWKIIWQICKLLKRKLKNTCMNIKCLLKILRVFLKMLLLCLMSIRIMFDGYILNFRAKIRDCENWELAKAWRYMLGFAVCHQMAPFFIWKNSAICQTNVWENLLKEAFANSQFSQSLILAGKFKI